MKDFKITYRGWAGHFILGDRCGFHLNTLIEYGDIKVIVSTIGRLKTHSDKGFEELGHNRYYEIMAFQAQKINEFWDIDVNKEINFESRWAWGNISDEWNANKGHLVVVEEMKLIIKTMAGEK